jgi:hypothetical protein
MRLVHVRVRLRFGSRNDCVQFRGGSSEQSSAPNRKRTAVHIRQAAASFSHNERGSSQILTSHQHTINIAHIYPVGCRKKHVPRAWVHEWYLCPPNTHRRDRQPLHTKQRWHEQMERASQRS